MARKCIVVGYVLLQSLSLIGSERPSGELRKSNDNLRKSSDTLSRSQSQELQKAAKAAVARMVYNSPCGQGGYVVDRLDYVRNYDCKHEMQPYMPFYGCP